MAKMSPAEVEKFLKGMNYPAKKEDLIKHVQEETQPVLDILKQLPDETFNKSTDVVKALGELESGLRGTP